MPKRCAICKKRTEGTPTFSVTPKRKMDWEYVVPNELLVGDRICHVHFPKEFLIKENTFCPGETKRRKPRVILKPDAYPLIESIVETQSNEPCNAFPIPQSNKSFSNANEITINSNEYSSDEYEDLTLPLSPNLLQIKFNPNGMKQYGRKKTLTSINSARNIFEKIYLNTDAVRFPTDWCRVIPGNNISVIFSKILLRDDDSSPYFERSVTINKQVTIKCLYMNYIISINHLGLNSCIISNIHELEDVICKMNNAIMCTGEHIPKELLAYKTNKIKVDCNGRFRHSNCSIVVDEKMSSYKSSSNLKCTFCNILLSSCQRKKLRRQNSSI